MVRKGKIKIPSATGSGCGFWEHLKREHILAATAVAIVALAYGLLHPRRGSGACDVSMGSLMLIGGGELPGCEGKRIFRGGSDAHALFYALYLEHSLCSPDAQARLEIRNSTIPASGLGLFLARDAAPIKRGEFVTLFGHREVRCVFSW
jgi:hypothetical protein